MPSARTATTATVRSSTGGISQARVISQAATPARASALPSERAPRTIASPRRPSRGRSKVTAMSNGSSRDKRLPSDPNDVIADGEDGLVMRDHDDRRTGIRTGDDGLQ